MNSIADCEKVQRVLLIQPWRDKRSIVYGEMEPYALMSLATVLKDAGVEVRILDLRIEKDALPGTLRSFQPQMVGLTAITLDFFMSLEVMRQVKAYGPAIITVVGGIHATLSPTDFKKEYVDFIVRGPGTKVLTDIITEVNGDRNYERIKGILYQDGKQEFIENKHWTSNICKEAANIRPLRNILRKQSKYRYFGFNHAVLSTAQGCSGRCSFCACWPAMGGKYMSKSPENVLQEVMDIVNNGQRIIFLADDNTFEEIDRAYQIVELIREYLDRSGVKIIMNGYCRANIIVEHPDLLKAWKEIGLDYLTVGVEAIHDQQLEAFKKDSNTRMNLQANEILRRLGILNMAHILIDPTFTHSDFQELWDFVYQNGITNPIFPILTALPGTVLFNRASSSQLYPYYDLAHPVERTSLPLPDFYREYEKLVLKNYSYSRWIKSHLKRLLNFLCKKTGLRPAYPDYECRAPQWITIPYNRYLMKSMIRSSKLKVFMKDYEEYVY